MTEEKATIFVETFINIIGLIILFIIGIAWNRWLLIEDMSLLRTVIYFIGSIFLFVKFMTGLFNLFKRIPITIKMLRS
jgi:hypothetical protein